MKKRRYLILLVTFLFGFGCALILGAVIDILDLAVTPAERLVQQWGICEDKDGNLLVPLLKDGIVVQIAHKPTSDRLQSIDVMKEEVGAIFEYKVAGELGTPSALYAGGPIGGGPIDEGRIWVDLNADGYFDERLIGKNFEILIDNQWVRAKKAVGRSALTDQGVFEFDTNKGKWIIVPVVPAEKSIRDEK